MTAMPGSTPQWTFSLRANRDVLVVRQRARQVAHLLHFSPLEQACIAAGVFMIADQARRAYSASEICFGLEDRQLTVCARPLPGERPLKTEAALLKLAKPLPEAAQKESPEDLGWLIARINDQTPPDLYGELLKQNQDVLQMVHLLQHPEARAESSFSAA
jgi:hypothetical protein